MKIRKIISILSIPLLLAVSANSYAQENTEMTNICAIGGDLWATVKLCTIGTTCAGNCTDSIGAVDERTNTISVPINSTIFLCMLDGSYSANGQFTAGTQGIYSISGSIDGLTGTYINSKCPNK